jgi:pyridoxine 5-phosphate synthase
MHRKALKYKPDWICLVPEKRAELTTEGGLDVKKQARHLGPYIEKIQRIGIEVSMFIAPRPEQVRASHAIGADAVELHTGHWVQYQGRKRQQEWKALVAAAELAHELGLRVHAGHGLDVRTTTEITKLPHLVEVNIGHFIVCEALDCGLRAATRKIKRALA